MPEKFPLPEWLVRNPLGIIALFISLIYGMSALLLGESVDKLTTYNQTIMVIFIAIFPIIVLFVFGWLVSTHHQKLYGPGDYRSDDGFLSAITPAPPSSIGHRLMNNAKDAQIEEGVSINAEEHPNTGAPSESDDSNNKEVYETHKNKDIHSHKNENALINKMYIAESLVFQELQNEYKASVQREVFLPPGNDGTLIADGILYADSGIILVDVKMVGNASLIPEIVHKSSDRVAAYKQFIEPHGRAIKLVIAFVIAEDRGNGQIPESDIFYKNKISEIVDRTNNEVENNVEIKVFYYNDIVSKYGLSDETTSKNVTHLRI